MTQTRTELRDNLLTALAFLFDPTRRLLVDAGWKAKLPFVESQFNRELRIVREQLNDFCQAGSLSQSQEHVDADNSICALRDCFSLFRSHPEPSELKPYVENKFNAAKNAIRSLPCLDAGSIIAGESPLMSYRQIVILCRAAKSRVDLFDPYLDKSVYDLYLIDVDPMVQINVVTAESNMKDILRRDRIVAVSELAAIQRADKYQLLVTTQQHDRHLRIDDQILHLGGSVKDAAKDSPYTISNLDATQSNDNFLNGLISASVEWVGKTVKKHRKTV